MTNLSMPQFQAASAWRRANIPGMSARPTGQNDQPQGAAGVWSPTTLAGGSQAGPGALMPFSYPNLSSGANSPAGTGGQSASAWSPSNLTAQPNAAAGAQQNNASAILDSVTQPAGTRIPSLPSYNAKTGSVQNLTNIPSSSGLSPVGMYPGGLTQADVDAQANASHEPQYAPPGSGMPGSSYQEMTPEIMANLGKRMNAEQAVIAGTERPSTDPGAIWNGVNLSTMTKKQMFDQYGKAGVDAWHSWWYDQSNPWQYMNETGGHLDQSLKGDGSNPSWNQTPIATGNPSGAETPQFTSSDVTSEGILTTSSGNQIDLKNMSWSDAQHNYSQQVMNAWLQYHSQ